MLAAFYVRTGPAREVLIVDEVNTPLPGPGEVRVRVHASGINPADVKRRAGESVRPLQFPMIIPHSDGAGVIDMAGGGIPRQREGERVWLWNTQWRRPFGTAAEYAVVPSEQAVMLPNAASFAFGATLGVPALTAHRCISVLGGRLRKKHVLIFGGGGMVGQFAVQFAKSHGAIVTATASSDAKAEVARLAGADHIVNHRTDDLVESAWRITNSAQFSYILDIDFAVNSQLYTRLLKRCGSVVVFGSASENGAAAASPGATDARCLTSHDIGLGPAAGSSRHSHHANRRSRRAGKTHRPDRTFVWSSVDRRSSRMCGGRKFRRQGYYRAVMKGCVGVCLPSWPYGSHCPRWWFGPEAPLRRELHRSPADFPIFTVVLDNGGWQAVKASVQRVYPGGAAQRTDSLLSQLRTGREGEQRRFIEISCAFGAHGEGVTDPDELDEAIARCLRALGDGRAAVLHVDAIPP